MIICLVYIGKVPSYVRHCVQQLRDWSSLKLYFITNDIENCKELLPSYDITYIHPDELEGDNLNILEEKRKFFSLCSWVQGREHLFYYSMLRLYLIENFMKKYNVQDVFHLEIDNLIYYDPYEFKKQFQTRGISYLYEDKERGCASVFYARDIDSIKHLNDTIITYIDVNGGFNSEMGFLGRYIEEHEDKVYILPHTIPPSINPKISSNFEYFNNNWVFDSMSIGMWLTGIDKIHSNGTLKKCKSPWIPLDITGYKYEWKENKKGKKYPVMIDDKHECRIFNLHIHSKDLTPYLSTKFKLPSNRTIISGEPFQEVCELFINVEDGDKDWVPRLKDDSRHIHINDITNNFDNPKYVYTRGWNLNRLSEILQKFKNPFVLVAHNADEWIKNNQQMLPYLDSPKIISFFSQNLIIKHPKAFYLPIGLANSRWPHGNQEIFKKYMNRTRNKEGNGIFFNFSIETAPWYRQDCYNKLIAKGLKWVDNKPYEQYLQDLITYKYAICPIGNGFDCHRTWECIYLGIIPIFVAHPFVEILFTFTKMIVLRDWNDLPVVNGILDESKLTVYLPSNEDIYAEDYIKKIKA
jgi:hypothetical protein